MNARRVFSWLLILVAALSLAACEGADMTALSEAIATAVPATDVPGQAHRYGRTADALWANVDQDLVAAVAEALGVPLDEIVSRLESGESLQDIAASLGYTSDDLWALAENLIEQGLLNTTALDAGEEGVLQTYVQQAWAEVLGLSPEELAARLDAGETIGDIARSLGYTTDELWALMSEVRAAAVEQALADGVITEDQAAHLLEVGPRAQGAAGQGQGFQAQGETAGDGILSTYVQAAWAEALGLSLDELTARLEAGESLLSIALSMGLSAEEVQALMDEVRATAVEQALADGVITEEQAARLLEQGMSQAQHQHQTQPSADALPTPMGQGEMHNQRRGRRWSP
ncbi:MAG: LysM peptidoglycan-binding domain-containing protein [Chloroflexi bacterium]|nr:LysM peptidoglycan-binding domain-containing protein [Chloroflexota bacterium]